MAASKGASIDGDDFRAMVDAGTRCIEQHVDAINALNVFPVPDGDTGINMLLTLRAAGSASGLPAPGTGTVAQVSSAIARSALLGARGNSGVIFSQFLKGLSSGLQDRANCDGSALRVALERAATAGYQAVGEPVEGTMLTVMRAAAGAANASADGSTIDVLRAAFDGAEEALRHTPEQLPVLKEAGVVDAGGQGVVAFLAGALAHLEGREPALEIAAPADAPATAAVSHAFLEHTEEELYGYCTQFVIQGTTLDVVALRQQVNAIAGSTVVVGDEEVVRVHAHAEDPGPLLSLGASVGALDQVKIENMDTMHQEFMARHGYAAASHAVAVVAVAPGDGLRRVFADLGAVEVVSGGQTMNPSARELMEAVDRAGADHVILLPNNGNVLLAAEQAKELGECPCTIVPSRTVPQGIAALLAFNPDLDAEANARAMAEALDGVRSGEVTLAVRSTTFTGFAVEQGQSMALLDGEIVFAGASPSEALAGLIAKASPGPGALITLYWGADLDEHAAGADAEALRAQWPEAEVEVVSGGQPHYHYLVSIE